MKLIHFFTFLLCLQPALSSADTCMETADFKVEFKNGEVHPGRLCWEDSYFVGAKEIPKHSIRHFEDPYMEVMQKKMTLDNGFGQEWCRYLGYSAKVEEEVGARLFSTTVLRPSLEKGEWFIKFVFHKAKNNEYLEGVSCSQRYYDLVQLNRERLGLASYQDRHRRVPPINLKKQR